MAKPLKIIEEENSQSVLMNEEIENWFRTLIEILSDEIDQNPIYDQYKKTKKPAVEKTGS